MKRSRILILILVLTLCAACFAACDPEINADAYKVTFIDGGAEVARVEVVKGGALTATQIPPAPEGHDDAVFLGWFVGDEKVEAGYIPQADVFAVARFEVVYTVTFMDGDLEISRVQVDRGEALKAAQIPPAPEGHGKDPFLGWFVGEEKVEAGFVPQSSVSASAKFTPYVPNWDEEAQALMRQYLHGLVLPYIDKDNNQVGYDAETNEIDIAGATVTKAELDAYVALYTAEDGWTDASDMFDSVDEYTHTFKKTIHSENEGDVYVIVEVYAIDGEGYPAEEGTFVINAYDPFLYEFPSAIFDMYIEQVFIGEGSAIPMSDHIPVFEADYYFMSLYEGPYFTPLPALMCYTDNKDAENDYMIALGQAGWTLDGTTEDGYTYAYSSDSYVAIEFKYSEEMKGLVIYMTFPPLLPEPGWPDAYLALAFKNYNWPAFEIPEFDYPTALYACYEDENNLQYAVGDKAKTKFVIVAYYCTEDNFNAYLEELKEAGWVQKEGESQTKIFTKQIDGKLATIDVTYGVQDKKYGVTTVINVYLYQKDMALPDWPADAIREMFDEYVKDLVPEYEGADQQGYHVYEARLFSEAYVEVVLNAGGEDAALNAYKATLEKAGFTPSQDGWYISANKQIEVMPEKGNGALNIYFRYAALTAWPDNVVAGEFEKRGFTDPLPALNFDGATYSYQIGALYDPDCFIIIVGVGYDDVEEQFEAYKHTLEAAGFTESSDYVDDLMDYVFYVSPDGKYKVEIWMQSGSEVRIEITAVE